MKKCLLLIRMMRKVCDKSESLTLCPTDGELIPNRTVCGILIVVTRFISGKTNYRKGFYYSTGCKNEFNYTFNQFIIKIWSLNLYTLI